MSRANSKYAAKTYGPQRFKESVKQTLAVIQGSRQSTGSSNDDSEIDMSRRADREPDNELDFDKEPEPDNDDFDFDQ